MYHGADHSAPDRGRILVSTSMQPRSKLQPEKTGDECNALHGNCCGDHSAPRSLWLSFRCNRVYSSRHLEFDRSRVQPLAHARFPLLQLCGSCLELRSLACLACLVPLPRGAFRSRRTWPFNAKLAIRCVARKQSFRLQLKPQRVFRFTPRSPLRLLCLSFRSGELCLCHRQLSALFEDTFDGGRDGAQPRVDLFELAVHCLIRQVDGGPFPQLSHRVDLRA
mmetsp:Transcript_29202/g.72828  ORF Transcript_29202/g.72828 Transcript_29202/m.72828 type:complete len:222 (-) Transcript_29202:829-1494(-)